jgi:hypothetical protein
VAPDVTAAAYTRRESMKSEVDPAEGVSGKDDRSERTPKYGGNGSPAPREKGLLSARREGGNTGRWVARSFEAMRTGQGWVHIGDSGSRLSRKPGTVRGRKRSA